MKLSGEKWTQAFASVKVARQRVTSLTTFFNRALAVGMRDWPRVGSRAASDRRQRHHLERDGRRECIRARAINQEGHVEPELDLAGLVVEVVLRSLCGSCVRMIHPRKTGPCPPPS